MMRNPGTTFGGITAGIVAVLMVVLWVVSRHIPTEQELLAVVALCSTFQIGIAAADARFGRRAEDDVAAQDRLAKAIKEYHESKANEPPK